MQYVYRKLCLIFFIFFFLTLCILPIQLFAGKGDQFPTSPTLNNGKKWRVAYYEGGSYPDYQIIFAATINGLAKLGWVAPLEFPEYNPDHQAFWTWFTSTVQSEYLSFLPNGYYSSDFKVKLRKEVRQQLLSRLQNKHDIDFIFAMGTWAGQDLATTENTVPCMVESSSNPIASKIIKSAEDSGLDNIHAKVDPDRYERQVRLFHEMVGFKKLGIAYENSEEGRTFAAIDALQKVAAERDFQLITCEAPFSNVSKKVAKEKIVQCYEKLAPQVDAVYITVHRGVTLANLPKILAPINQHKLPSFSMKGSEEVKHGVLMSISQANFKYVGEFHAEVMARILNGAKPREIKQIWKAPPKIALNLKTAQTIGFDPPVDILMASDEIYETVEVTQKEQ